VIPLRGFGLFLTQRSASDSQQNRGTCEVLQVGRWRDRSTCRPFDCQVRQGAITDPVQVIRSAHAMCPI